MNIIWIAIIALLASFPAYWIGYGNGKDYGYRKGYGRGLSMGRIRSER